MKVHPACRSYGHVWGPPVRLRPSLGDVVRCGRCFMFKEIHADGSRTYLGMPTLEDALAEMDAQDAEWEDILPALDDDLP